MSNIYIPELMELDSYWQKAVEDAIRDTIKGEEKLQNALRNRKKINEKLKMFGLKSILSRFRFTKTSSAETEQAEEQDLDSGSEVSTVAAEEEGSEHNLESDKSRSRSGDTPLEDKKQKSPFRHLFGNESLDKIKKSQNSFNYEPMGDNRISEELSEPDKEEEEGNSTVSGKSFEEERDKNVQMLHMRDDLEFENSDSESMWAASKHFEKFQFLKQPLAKNKNYFFNEKPRFRSNSKERILKRSKKAQRQLHLLSNEKSKNPAKDHKNLERRLQLALAKREILNKKLKLPDCDKSNSLIKISRSAAKIAEEQRKGKMNLSSFIRFYLEVYRELYQKVPLKRIAEEAAKRWRGMSVKEKAEWADDEKANQF